MRLLQKYILGELVRVFLIVLSALTVLLVFVGAFGQMAERGLGPEEILQILPFLVPSMLPFTIPATLLLTVTVVYGRIAADHEVTAAKAAGISASSLLWPCFIMAAVLSIVSLLLTDQVIPWAWSNIEVRVAHMMEKIFLDILRNRGYYSHPDQALTIEVKDVDGVTLIDPVIRFTPKGGDTLNIFAEKASISFDLKNREVHVKLLHANGEIPNRQNFRWEHEDFTFQLPEAPEKFQARMCTIRDLRSRLIRLTANLNERHAERDIETAFALGTGDFARLSQPDVTQYDNDLINNRDKIARIRMDTHSRFALSASCFFFVLLGGPFSILQARRQVLTTFFLCFLPILTGYYPIVMLMINLSKSELINPAWGMWTGNAVLVPFAWVTMRKVLKH
jgi:lipopolysaccharide export system permease protein